MMSTICKRVKSTTDWIVACWKKLDAVRLQATAPGHIQPQMDDGGYELMYRQPYQPSLDGNTVEGQVEMAAYSDNAMRYLTTLRILSNKLNTMRTALKGQ